MAYEPTGKSKPFVDAVRREPARIWTPAEAAILMGVPQSSVGAWLAYPMKADVVHRGKRNGQVVYAGQPFPPEAAYPTVSESNAPAVSTDVRAPQFDRPWIPPKMIAVRPGSEPAPASAPSSPAPAPAPIATRKPLCAGCTRTICWDKGCVAGKVQDLIVQTALAPPPAPQVSASAPAPAPAPAALDIDPLFPAAHYGHDLRPGDGMVGVPPGPAPAAANASIPEGAGPADVVEFEEEEAVEPDAFYSCRTGEIVLVGLEADEDGRVTIPADLVMAIRRAVAWAPPPRSEAP